jgi:hypothetical protein
MSLDILLNNIVSSVKLETQGHALAQPSARNVDLLGPTLI